MKLTFTSVFFLGLTFTAPTYRYSDLVQRTPVVRSMPDIHALIEQMAEKHRVSANFVKSIVAAESNFDCHAVSRKGAIGLMQLMPQTAHEWGADPTIPAQNIEAGTRYLGFLIQKYQNTREPLKFAAAAYNAGPGAVDRYHGVPPFKETRGYVTRVLTFFRQFQRQSKIASIVAPNHLK